MFMLKQEVERLLAVRLQFLNKYNLKKYGGITSKMGSRTNMSCAACGVVFDNNSDIVYCPECGAPHHRECWNEAGHCSCESLHSSDYAWTSNSSSGSSSDESVNDSCDESNLVSCPICGSQTSEKEEYCEKCGYYLAHGRKGAYGGAIPNQSQSESLFDISDGEIIEGVPAGDIKKFVGTMWIYYLPRFSVMSKKLRSFTFNFTAGITHGLWFIARKMYGLGAFLTLLMTVIACYQMYFMTTFQNLYGNQTNSADIYMNMSKDHPWMVLGMLLFYVLGFLQYGVMIWCGIFGNKCYMKHTAKRIKKINAKASAAKYTPEQFNEELEQKGGVAKLFAASVGFCYMIILYALNQGLIF